MFTRETVVGYTNKVTTSVDNEFDSLDCMQHWTLSKLDYRHNYSPENQIPIYYTVVHSLIRFTSNLNNNDIIIVKDS